MHNLLHNGVFGPNDEGNTGASGAVADTPENVFSSSETTEAPGESGSGAEQHAGGSERSETTSLTPSATGGNATNVTMTTEQLTSLASQMVRALPQQQAPQQQRQEQPITPEQQAEFDRAFNVVRVTPQIFESVMGVAPQNEAQMKALETLLHGVVRQANAMTTYQMNQEMARKEQALQARYQPVVEYVSTQQANALREGFFKEHPDLKDFESLANEVIKSAKSEGRQFPDAKSASTFVATRVREHLTKARGGQPPPKTGTSARKTMPTTSMGGRMGSNNGSQQPVSGPQSVFQDLDS